MLFGLTIDYDQFKGIVHPKRKLCHLLTLKLFQTRTQKKIFERMLVIKQLKLIVGKREKKVKILLPK